MPWHDLRVRHPITVIAGAVLLLAACNDDGRTLAPAPSVPVSQLTTTTVGPPAPVAELTLESPAFDEGGFIDPSSTCHGVNVPPTLLISGVPPGTAELAITVTDVDADGFVHWVLGGLDPGIARIEAGLIPADARTARTDSGVDGWDGPCPPEGDDPHAYHFAVHALPEPVGLAPGITGREAIGLIEQAAIESDTLVGFYAAPETG